MATTPEAGPTGSEFIITRSFEAPRAALWQAWTEAGRLQRWFGPQGFTLRHCTIDLRPGGVFHYGMAAPDGSVMWGRWVLREIVAPERLVFVVSFSDEKAGVSRHPWSAEWPLETLSTMTLAGNGSTTTVTVTWVPLNATATEMQAFAAGHDSMRQGWTGTLDKLADYLAKA